MLRKAKHMRRKPMMRTIVATLAFGLALLAFEVSSTTPAQAGDSGTSKAPAVAKPAPAGRVAVVPSSRSYYRSYGPRRHYVGGYGYRTRYYGPDMTDGYYNPGYTQSGYYADPGMYADGNYYDGGHYNGRDAGYGGNYYFR